MKDNNNITVKNVGIGFSSALSLLFIALKLLGVINWSWLWVLSPLWIPMALVLFVVMLCLVIAVVQVIKDERRCK